MTQNFAWKKVALMVNLSENDSDTCSKSCTALLMYIGTNMYQISVRKGDTDSTKINRPGQNICMY